ncbi:MAG: type VI secretion system protein VasG [Glomeribacter sp. 1016415]|nr:type VI secretion system protein VasG [Glomeribacter sp. 1016415]
MPEISRLTLFGKLNPLAYRAVESGTVFCKLRGNPYVELSHWLHQILQLQDSDIHRIIRYFEIDLAHLARDMTHALDQLPRGSTSIMDISSQVEEAVERGWVLSSLMFGAAQIRTGYLLFGILKTASLRHALFAISRQFEKIKLDDLADNLTQILKESVETGTELDNLTGQVPTDEPYPAPAALGKQQALKRFTIDLTEQARSGKLDPIIGRAREIRQVIDILMRRRQNNPILVGEAGVGKTAVVEGLAQAIAAGNVPPSLKEVTLRVLDLGLLKAGASMKGEFEERLRQVIEEVQTCTKPIVLFIDEAHTLVGAGGMEGTGDAANLLKPALARGTLRTVAATTWAEYKKYIEKDPALTRRFQAVTVLEPSEEDAITMLRGMALIMEKHHKVQVLDEALSAAVKLSHRYIPARQLPDKAVSLLDTACARVAVSQHATPASIAALHERMAILQNELEILERETAAGIDTTQRTKQVAEKLQVERDHLGELEVRWQAEQRWAERIFALKAKLSGLIHTTDTAPAALSKPETEACLAELRTLQNEMAHYQAEEPLILLTVDYQAVATIVQEWTGIPVGRMVKNDIQNVLHLAEILNQRIIGQNHAIEMIAKRIQTSRAGLEHPNKPIGVFMLAGPSGVGKTETALALAEALYGGEQNLTTINMSEYQEAHTVSSLKGAPPGYVGYGEGGVLTEAVRRRPYGVILLDEVEKAHPDVHEIFFQVFDKGWMEDGEGRAIDFKNTLILLTTNVGSEQIMDLCQDPARRTEPDKLAKSLRGALLDVFPPALLGRLVVIPYYPLNEEMLDLIIRLQLRRIEQRVRERYQIPFTVDDEVVKLIAARCEELESGGRMIDAILTNTLLPHISNVMLNAQLMGEGLRYVHVSVKENEFAYEFGAEGQSVTPALIEGDPALA